jgi:hypothetical protein
MSMATKHRAKTIAKSQRGFALLMVMFMTTLVLLVAIAAAPYVRTEGRREKEEEMIWRGKQYVRGIKLYYRKTGHFPTSVDDLTKPKLGSLRFMRQAYKDPMNKEDGSWRFIYVGPNGQLIGSLKPPQSFQIPGVNGGVNGAQPGTPAGASAQQTVSFGASGFGQQPPAQPGVQGQPGQPGQPGANPNGATAGQPGSAGQSTAGNTASDDAANAAPSGLLSADSALVGGNIIGVGSKINKRSVIVYDKAKNYRLFEFVWNPSKDMANALNQQIGAPGQNPAGVAPGQGQGQGQTGFGLGQQNNQQNNQQNPPPTTDMPLPTPPPPVPTPPPE